MFHIIRDPSAQSIESIRRRNYILDINEGRVGSFLPRYKNDGLSDNDVLIVANSFRHPNPKLSTLGWGIRGGDGMKHLTVDAEELSAGKHFTINDRQHCIIFAEAFYVNRYDGKNGRIPYYIYPILGDYFAFAGIWDVWKDNGGQIQSGCAILTNKISQVSKLAYVNNVDLLAPLALTETQEKIWLNSGIEESIVKIMGQEDNENFQGYTISPAINLENRNPFDEKLITHIAYTAVSII